MDSQNGRVRRAGAVLCIGLLVAAGGGCTRKSDEAILRERIDSTPVHLYVATKIAVTRSEGSPEVREARRRLEEVQAVLERYRASRQGHDSPPVLAAAAGERVELRPQDLARLTAALWALRSEGQQIVRSGREDALSPVLPVLLPHGGLSPGLAEILDTNMEHALTLAVLTALKFHPRSPVPVPEEVLLYEAWMTHPEGLRLPGMAPHVHAIKAVAYGTNELCDLAAAEAAQLPAPRAATDPTAMTASLQRLTGGRGALDAEQATMVAASGRLLAHGITALCYFQRREPAPARRELAQFIEAAHASGVPPTETAMVRAYLAYENGDRPGARRALEEARANPNLPSDERAQIDALQRAMESGDNGTVQRQFNRARLTALTLRFGYESLERAGLFRALQDSEAVRTLVDYGETTARALSSARATVSTDAAEKTGWFRKLLRR
jgi:hypothetical protein